MRHSDLTSPADLHFSKFKTFTGLPSAVTPDFADQIFAATDTNKIYRATGTAQGNLIELAPQEQNGGTGSTNYTLVSTFSGSPFSLTPDFINQLFAAVDTNKIYRATGTNQGQIVELAPSESPEQALIQSYSYPSFPPEFEGQLYFDRSTGVLLFARGLTVQDWRPVYEDMQVDLTVSNNIGGQSITFDLYYSPQEPQDGFNFTFLAGGGVATLGSTFSARAFQDIGTGFYVMVPSSPNPSVIVRSSTSSIEHPIDNRLIFSTESLSGTFTANGQPVSSDVLRFSQFPKTGTLFGSTYSVSFEANSN